MSEDKINPKHYKSDIVVEEVINELRLRSSVGIYKYGTTLEDNNSDDFLQHLKEELMDATLHLTKIQRIIKTTTNDTELGEKIRRMYG